MFMSRSIVMSTYTARSSFSYDITGSRSSLKTFSIFVSVSSSKFSAVLSCSYNYMVETLKGMVYFTCVLIGSHVVLLSRIAASPNQLSESKRTELFMNKMYLPRKKSMISWSDLQYVLPVHFLSCTFS